MNCPQCGLSVRLRARYLMLEHCPRCLGRRRRPVKMIATDNRPWPSQINATCTVGIRSPVSEPCLEDHRSTPGELIIRTERDPDALVLALFGELDLATVAHLDRELRGAITRDAERVIVDLSGLQFMDSRGLHVLLDAAQRCRETSRHLSFLRGVPLVQRLFELTATQHALTFDD